MAQAWQSHWCQVQASRVPAAKEGLTCDLGLPRASPGDTKSAFFLRRKPDFCSLIARDLNLSLGWKVSQVEILARKKNFMPKSLSICQLPLQAPPGIAEATCEGLFLSPPALLPCVGYPHYLVLDTGNCHYLMRLLQCFLLLWKFRPCIFW